jgi:hypothetical protein
MQMSTAALVTTEEQRQVLEETLGPNPFRPSKSAAKSKGERWTAAQRAEKEQILNELGRVKPCVIVNFNPFMLKVNGGMLFKGAIPACPVGEPYRAHVLTEARWMTVDKGCGLDNIEQFDPVPYVPAHLATEYMREYVNERQTGGVLIFMGSSVPKDLNVEVDVPVQRPGGDGPNYLGYEKRNLKQMWDETIGRQNQQILKVIEDNNTFYEDPEMRKNITDVSRAYVRLAVTRGILKPEDRPRWVLSHDTLKESKEEPCPACGATPLPGAAVCVNCGDYVFDRLKAFRAGVIDIEHRSMADATDAEWKEIQNIQKRRDRIKAQREGKA